jgi:hypothetical protein
VVGRKKWYSYFVVTEEPGVEAGRPEAASAAPRRVEDLAPEAGAPAAAAPPDVAAASRIDLGLVYESAKIAAPPHGYTVLKVAEMLESEHLHALPPDVKRKSVLAALDAAGVSIEDVIQDAVRRDRALDTYERVLEGHLETLRKEVAAENAEIEQAIARQLAELRARIDENRLKVEQEERELLAWRTRKHHEEERIANAVSPFVSENPISAPARTPAQEGKTDAR